VRLAAQVFGMLSQWPIAAGGRAVFAKSRKIVSQEVVSARVADEQDKIGMNSNIQTRGAGNETSGKKRCLFGYVSDRRAVLCLRNKNGKSLAISHERVPKVADLMLIMMIFGNISDCDGRSECQRDDY
jgi:hypothetical protein